ncbi:hypothetical protein Q3G72_021193 [Acer saccharum]|nr:hypothetical protein Q3G72_021193 [Acer saccharum]
MASLSSWSLGDKVLHWYEPKNREQWIPKAVTSLKTIAENYHLDGIDIDYERFAKGSSSSFAYCIGELITSTAAPYYVELFKGYGDVIDYVNHQFYTDRVKTLRGYLEAFKLRANQFNKEKLLPNYEINGRGIQVDAFFDALKMLEANGLVVNGVMIFSADDSASNGFFF